MFTVHMYVCLLDYDAHLCHTASLPTIIIMLIKHYCSCSSMSLFIVQCVYVCAQCLCICTMLVVFIYLYIVYKVFMYLYNAVCVALCSTWGD